MSSFFNELKRRNVVRVGLAYLVMGWIVLQILDVIVEPLRLPEWTATFVIVILGIGLPIALLLSWAYEMTSSGVKKTEEVDADASITPSTGRRLDRFIMAGLVIAVAFLIWDRTAVTVSEPAAETPKPVATAEKPSAKADASIAVLPFVNMSSDPEQEYFSDGISEEILNALVRVDGLSVASRTSSFNYKGREQNLTEIARELKVAHILEGSVRKSGTRVRITAQLIDARNDRHLWSETYDRELTDIFAIQDEIAKAIVEALKEALELTGAGGSTVTVASATENMDAYERYLKARQLFLARGRENLHQSETLFREAVTRDPAFARAWEGLASVLFVLPGYDFEIEGDEYILKAVEAADKAIALDASLAVPHSIRAQGHAFKGEWAEALAEDKQAVALEPRNATVRLWRGLTLIMLGYMSEALEETRLAQSLDPTTGVFNAYYGLTLQYNGRPDEAWPFYVRAARADWQNSAAVLRHYYLDRGDLVEATLTGMIYFPRSYRVVELANLLILDPRRRDQLLPDLRARVEALGIAWQDFLDNQGWQMLMAMGEDRQGVDILLGNIGLRFWLWHRHLKALRQTSGFRLYLKESGMVDFWREQAWPDLCRPKGPDDYECD